MCGGPSQTQMDLQESEKNFYDKQVAAYDTAYSKYSQITDYLKAQFDPILKAGPGQMGYTPDELTTLRTQSTEGTAQNYAAAQRALQQRIATQGGGTSNVNVTGGPQQQLQEELAATGAGEMSREQLGITSAGYDVGRQMWQQAVAGEENLASGWNPNAFSGSAVNAGTLASNTANTITQQQNAVWGSVLGALGGIGSSVIDANPKGIFS